MRNFIWAISSIGFIVVFTFVLLLAKMDDGDVMYAMLSGSIGGAAVSLLALSRRFGSSCSSLIMFNCIVGSGITWLLAVLLLKIATVNLYGTTAVAFDLIVGLVSALSIGGYLLDYYSSHEQTT